MKEKAKKILDFLSIIEPLKSVTRHSWCSDGRRESVAEHTWRMTLMAILLEDEFPEADIKKVVAMCLLHDLGEIKGDIPAFEKERKDYSLEFDELKKMARTLPAELEEKIISLHHEFNACLTLEAKLANALDKLEAVIQHNDAALSTWTEIEYKLNLTYGQEKTSFHPFLSELRRLVRQRTADKISSGNEGRNKM